MNEFTCYVGNQIKSYRKAARLTLQQLGDAIHKSRATVCKYESGEISPDLETLYEISQILQVSPAQLTAIRPDIQHPFVFGVPAATETTDVPGRMQKNPFFQARRLYFIFMTDAAAGSKTASSTSARRPTYQIPMKQPSQSARFPETGAAVKLFIPAPFCTVTC